MEFDTLGRLVRVAQKDPMGLLLSSKKIAYDAVGNKIQERHDQFQDHKLIGSTTLNSRFGPMGRLEEEQVNNEAKIVYTYNSRGQLSSKSSRLQSPFKYTYDLLGRLGHIECSESSTNQTISNQYDYDQRDNVILAKTQEGVCVERKYDVFNQVTQEIFADEYGKYETSYTYDRKGRLISFKLPDESKIVYTYDALYGREVKRLSPQGDTLYSHQYNCYDEQGKLLVENLINQASSREHIYNLNGQKIQSKCDFSNEDIQRDSLGRILEVKKQASFKVSSAEFKYNDLSQLISEQSDNTKTYVSIHSTIVTKRMKKS